MPEERPTRWQKAKADWPGFQRRDLIAGLIALGIAILVLVESDFPGSTVAEVAIVGGSAIVASVLYAVLQLVWAWLQAPMRLLTEDVIAIRERVNSLTASDRAEDRETALAMAREHDEAERQARRALNTLREELGSLDARALEEIARGADWGLESPAFSHLDCAARNEIAGYPSLNRIAELLSQVSQRVTTVNRQMLARHKAKAQAQLVPYGDHPAVVATLRIYVLSALDETETILKSERLLDD